MEEIPVRPFYPDGATVVVRVEGGPYPRGTRGTTRRIEGHPGGRDLWYAVTTANGRVEPFTHSELEAVEEETTEEAWEGDFYTGAPLRLPAQGRTRGIHAMKTVRYRVDSFADGLWWEGKHYPTIEEATGCYKERLKLYPCPHRIREVVTEERTVLAVGGIAEEEG